MENYYEEFETSSIRNLREGGYLEDYTYEKKFLGSRRTGKELRVTEKGKVLYENLIKFKNYLKDYLDQVTEEVDFNKWEEYLIYSSIFFLDKEFVEGAKAYPAYVNNYALYNTHILATRNFLQKIKPILSKWIWFCQRRSWRSNFRRWRRRILWWRWRWRSLMIAISNIKRKTVSLWKLSFFL